MQNIREIVVHESISHVLIADSADETSIISLFIPSLDKIVFIVNTQVIDFRSFLIHCQIWDGQYDRSSENKMAALSYQLKTPPENSLILKSSLPL